MPNEHAASVSPSRIPALFEEVLDHFESAWQTGIPPAMGPFVPAGMRGRRRLLRELIKVDLEYRWRRSATAVLDRVDPAGLPAHPRLEDYLQRFPRLGPVHRLPLDLIGEEYRVRQRWGDRPSHAEYLGRFPWLQASLPPTLRAIDVALQREDGRTEEPSRRDVCRLSPSFSRPLRCPHCQQILDLVPDQTLRNLVCPACGEAFHIEALPSGAVGTICPASGTLGRYQLGKLLGTGAFGSVWQARDQELGREVAVKVPRAGQFAGAAEEERFLREARYAAQLRHPGIVAVHDVGRDQHTLYIVSELVRGVNLAEWLRETRVSFLEAAELVSRVADALEHAHRQGVVHRDVKPSNILLEDAEGASPGGTVNSRERPSMGRPRVMDFGLALRDAGEVTMTLDGQVLGTPAYMSPEQLRSPHTVDGRSDVYSLGVILYELLTGELPFRGTARMLLHQVASDAPRPLRRLNDRIPRDLETICLTCLHKEPERRYRTAAALAADLRRWLAGDPIQARPPGWAERLRRWVRRNLALAMMGGLALATLVAVSGAAVAAMLVAATLASLLFALHKANAAGELARDLQALKLGEQRRTAALQFAARHCALARRAQERSHSAEARAKRQFARLREFAQTMLFDFPEKIGKGARTVAARLFLARTVLTYLDGLAGDASQDGPLLRELALAYARVAELQRDLAEGKTSGRLDVQSSLRKSLALFEVLAHAHPDNLQAQRDLQRGRARMEEGTGARAGSPGS